MIIIIVLSKNMNNMEEIDIVKEIVIQTYPNTFYSSFIFLTNVILNLTYGYYLYAFLFIILTITSLIYHSNTTNLTYIIDKLGIIFVVLYGGYFFYNKCLNIQKPIDYFYAVIIVVTFLSTIFLYYYGFQCKHYCFSVDDKISQFYHVIIHLLSSVGHHLIAFM